MRNIESGRASIALGVVEDLCPDGTAPHSIKIRPVTEIPPR